LIPHDKELQRKSGAQAFGRRIKQPSAISKGVTTKKSQATKRCPEYVGWTCDRLAEILDRSEGEA
jgi:hypothetical protein